MFVEGKKSFTNFLQRNGSTVTEVVFASGSLKFESLTEILQNIESLQKIEFDAIKYEVSNTNQTIDQATCQNLVELVIRNPETPDGKLLKEAFKECQTIKTVKTPDSDMKVSKEVVQDEQVKLQDEKLNSFLIKKILQKDPENQDTSENLMDPEAEKKALPNFLTHLNNIYREELPKVEDRQFGEIFEHFNDKANSLRTGLQGSRVYKGKFQRRPIAIKRVIKDLKNIFDRDVSIMLQIDQHSSIFKYFSKEITEYIIYFGTELCEGNLATFIKDHSLRTKITAKTIFRQTAEGLMHLHQFNISKYIS